MILTTGHVPVASTHLGRKLLLIVKNTYILVNGSTAIFNDNKDQDFETIVNEENGNSYIALNLKNTDKYNVDNLSNISINAGDKIVKEDICLKNC